MTRIIAALTFILFLAPVSRAQDMPLSQILIDGEGWKKGEGKRPSNLFDQQVKLEVLDPNSEIFFNIHIEYKIGNRKFTRTASVRRNGRDQDMSIPPAIAGFVSRDGGTLFLGYEQGYILAYPAQADGTVLPGQPYCPVRVALNERKTDPQVQPSQVTAMTGDKDGRIYAATPLGVQVFDPTGRLCGVLMPASPGKVEYMAFEDDKLTLWTGDMKFERKLNTTGIKTAK